MKASEAITFKLASAMENLSQTKWNKLMFFIDGTGFCRRGRTFTGFEYRKLPYGPVPKNYGDIMNEMIWKSGIIKKDRYNGITDAVMYIEPVDDSEKKQQAQEALENENDLKIILDKVISIFRDWTAVRMSDFTHELAAWKRAEMFKTMDLSPLKDDPFLRKTFGQADLGELIMR